MPIKILIAPLFVPGIQIGPLLIPYYGMILMFGVLSAAFLTAWLAKSRGFDSEIVWDGLIWVLIGGIIGARLWHIFTPMVTDVGQGLTTAYYLTHPLEAISIWRGGLGIPGAVIGGVLAMYIFSRRRKLNFFIWLDISAPGLALGQAIGRWGNYINQELFGLPSDLPWAINIDLENRPRGYENVATFHPLFLYESLFSFANVLILLFISKKFTDRLYDGDVFLIYLILYPLERFLLEFLRLTPSEVLGININQAIMALIALIAGAILIIRHVRARSRNS